MNYTASKPAYEASTPLLRIDGILMVVGIPVKGFTVNALEVALGKYRIAGANNSIPQNMAPCIEFSAKHNIKPHCTFYKLDQIQEMIDTMHSGKATGRLVVKFDD